MATYIKKVAIVGAGGRIGGVFAEELVKSGKHTVTALTRADSKSKMPAGVHAVSVDYDKEETLVAALTGQEFLVITVSVMAPPDTHSKIVQAAVKAGVPWIMPNAYGYNCTLPELRADVPRGQEAWVRAQEVKELGAAYVLMVCGFWYQWSIAMAPCFGFDIKSRKVTFFDDGKTKMSVSTWAQCGRALVGLLALPVSGATPAIEDWKNQPLFIESFQVTQRDMLDSLNRVLGTTDKDWEISHEPSDQRYKEGMEELKQGNIMGMAKAMYARNFYPTGVGLLDSKRLANDALGIKHEDLDPITKDAVRMVESGFNPFAGSG